ncbi:endopeptidase Rz [Klebsiella phage vB_Kp3]|nr:endopeptidase Rz [Klebsiella phage vB_Kp3]
MIGNLKIYLLAALAAFLLWQGGSYALTRYGESRYESGVTAGINKEAERRNKIDRDLAEMRQREKDQDDRDTTRRIDQARADAASAAYAADRLRQQLNAATAIAKQHASAVGVSSDAGTLADLLAELFYQSVQAGNELAAEADRYYIAGQRCNTQYNRLLQATRSNK